MMHGLMPLKASAYTRYSTDDASGGVTPPAETKPGDATGGDKDEKKFSQSEMEAILKDRLAQKDRALEREKAEAAKAADEAARADAVKKLAEGKQWEELAAARQAEVDALTAKVKQADALAEKAARYEALLVAKRDADFGALPEEIKELLAGKDIAEQTEWLTKYASKLAARTDDDKTATNKTGGTPRPAKGKPATPEISAADLIERKRKQLGVS